MKDEVKLIELLPRHSEAMHDLHAKGFDHAWPQADFRAHIGAAHDVVMGAMIGDGLVGFVVARALDDQGEILTIAVDPDQRRLGIGALLMDNIETTIRARGVDIMFLDVAKDNLGAAALYRALGYVGCGIRKAYYRRAGGRVDALLLSKKF